MILFLTALKRIPAAVWFGILGIAAIVGLWWLVVSYGQSKYADGYASALTKAEHTLQVDTVDRVVARTDTVIKRVTTQIAIVDTLITQVPDTVRLQFPVVDTALKACTALAQDCAALRTSVMAERTTWAVRDTALRLTIVAKTDTVQSLRKRWTKKAAVLGALLAGGAGFAAGRR